VCKAGKAGLVIWIRNVYKAGKAGLLGLAGRGSLRKPFSLNLNILLSASQPTLLLCTFSISQFTDKVELLQNHCAAAYN
jgi:hypothetical protein